MRKNRIISFLLIMAFVLCQLSLVSCSNKKPVVEAATSFAEALADGNAKNIIKMSYDLDDELEEEINYFLDYNNDDYLSDDTKEMIDYMFENITVEVDEDSVDISKDEAEVKVIFTMPDYLAVYEEEDYSSVDEYIDLLEDADTTTVKAKLSLVKDDDKWLVDSPEKVISNVCSFLENPVVFSEDLSEIFESLTFTYPDGYDDNGMAYYYLPNNLVSFSIDFSETPSEIVGLSYSLMFEGEEIESYDIVTDSYSISVSDEDGSLGPGIYTINLYFEESLLGEYSFELRVDSYTSSWYSAEDAGIDGQGAVYNYASYINLYCGQLWGTDCYYEVYRDFELIYTSEIGEYDAYYSEDQGAVLENGILPSGYYEIKFYLGGVVVSEGYAYVNQGDPEVSNIEFRDLDFENSISEIYFWDYDDTSYGPFHFDDSTTTLEFTAIPVDPEATEVLYYSYYYLDEDYLETGLFDTSDYVYLFTDVVAISIYTDNTYYECQYNSDDMEEGGYLVIISRDPNPTFDNCVVAALCVVDDFDGIDD